MDDISLFYKEHEPDLKQTTINWRVYYLVQKSVLKRIGRGKFKIGEGKNYIPEISSKIRSLNTKLKKEFPYLKICIWDTSVLNEFMIHQPGRFYLLVEVEKEALDPVFYFLKEAKYPAFVNPTQEIIEKYLPGEKEAVIVKPLVSEAPIQNLKGVNTASLEKMLVDIFCDNVIFSAHQGSEMRKIFMEVFTKYTLNQNRMLRYADRRRKKENFNQYLNSITNLRQD